MATIRLYCGPVIPSFRPRCVRAISMRAEIVSRSLTSVRNRRSEPPSSRLARDAVGGRTNVPASGIMGALLLPGRRRGRALLEADIAGIIEKLRLDRNVKAVVDGVVELPEADDAGKGARP